jgi:hypothetical protein
VSPPSCEQIRQEARERPKSLRLLPRITADAVRLVWAANPRMLIASIALKLVSGAGLGAALVFGRNLIGSVLSAGTSTRPTPRGSARSPPRSSYPPTRHRRSTIAWYGRPPVNTDRSRWFTA